MSALVRKSVTDLTRRKARALLSIVTLGRTAVASVDRGASGSRPLGVFLRRWSGRPTGTALIEQRRTEAAWPGSESRSAQGGPVSALAFVLLGLAAAALVLLVIPGAFAIESSCVTSSGSTRTVGDTYIAGFVVLGTLGWLAAFLGMIYANIADRRDVAMLVPLVWSATLVLTALVVAALLGPAPCPS